MPNKTFKTFPNLALNLLKLRTEKKLTLRELATLSGLTAQGINQIETGKTTQPSLITIVQLANAFNVTVEILIN